MRATALFAGFFVAVGAVVLLSCTDLGSLSGGAADAGADGAVDAQEPGDAGGDDAGADAFDSASDADAGANCEGSPACERVVFVTGAVYTGDLGDLPGADAKCQSAADNSVLTNVHGRTFRAWLSSSTTPALDRLVHGLYAYRRPDGTRVAANFSVLTSGTLEAPIAVDENGLAMTSGSVWTGTAADGRSSSGNQCASFTSGSSAQSAAIGDLTAELSSWTESGSLSCNVTLHLYCIER